MLGVVNGEQKRFWEGEWVDGVVLKESFLKILALSRNKHGISDFGEWVEGRWKWRIDLRRPTEMKKIVERKILVRETEDRCVWHFDKSGQFTTRSFIKTMWNREEHIAAEVWYHWAHPKVQLLVWQMLWEKLPTKDMLHKYGIMRAEDLKCLSCCLEMESLDHTMPLSEKEWQVWSKIIETFGIMWTFPRSI